MTDTVNCSCLINSRGVVLVWCRPHFEALKKEQLAEREACAKIADDHAIGDRDQGASVQTSTATEIAALIRNRS